MNHALTVGEVLVPIITIGGIFALAAIIFFVIWLFNPFRSGH